MSRVRVRESFRVDVRTQVAWLRRHRDPSWVLGLREGLREAKTLLARFPAAGTLLEERNKLALRKLVLRRLPFNVLYVVDGEDAWLVRLFHHRQSRRSP